MSYTIEVYRGRQRAERHPGIYALYVLFYPQLVAGPIERPQHMLHQFRRPHRFSADRAGDGLRRMLWGFFKKLVIADRIARSSMLSTTSRLIMGGGICSWRRTCLHSRFTATSRATRTSRWGRPRPGIPPDGELRSALRVSLRGRVLAPLAYFPLDLVSRLPVCPAGREPGEREPMGAERAGRLRGKRPVARRELDVCRMGPAARLLPCHVSPDEQSPKPLDHAVWD